MHRDLGPVLAAFVRRPDEQLHGQRRVKRLDGGDLRIVDVAEHAGRHHAVGFGRETVGQFDQAAAVDRVAQRLAHLQSDLVILERLLPVGRDEHPDAGIDILLELLGELRVLLVAGEVRGRDVHPVQPLVALASLVCQD